MNAIIAVCLAIWGVLSAPAIAVEFYQNDNGQLAQTGAHGGNCLIAVYEPGWNTLSADEQRSLMLHEVGHCLGLDHFGSCNYNEAIMGCWSLPEPTGYDRARLAALNSPAHRAVLPMVGN